jgi:hypothetical protein
VIKRYVRAFGEGVEKVFWYPFIGLPILKEYPVFGSNEKVLGLGWDFPKNAGKDQQFHPRQAYYAYKLMAGKLGSFSSVEKIADTQYKFIFTDKKPVYVLWGSREHVSLPAGITGNVKVTDCMGKEGIKLASEIVLSEDPVFLE